MPQFPAQVPPLASAIYALAYLVGGIAFYVMACRRRIDPTCALHLMAVGLLGGLVIANLSQRAFGGQPGKSVLGAVLGGYLSIILYKRHIGLRRPTGDLFAVALALGEGIGRFGCFVGGCCYGKACSLPLAVWQHEQWRHPSQLYLSFACLLIFGILVWREKLGAPENTLFFLQGALYSAARFAVEFTRDGASLAAGLTTAQWVCVVWGLFCVVKLHGLTASQGKRHENVPAL